MTDITTALEDAQAHLAAVLLQTVKSDDEIIMGHVRDAHALIRAVRRQLADPVIDWPRASCYGRDTGLRYGDGLKTVSMPTLMDDDGPDNAA